MRKQFSMQHRAIRAAATKACYRSLSYTAATLSGSAPRFVEPNDLANLLQDITDVPIDVSILRTMPDARENRRDPFFESDSRFDDVNWCLQHGPDHSFLWDAMGARSPEAAFDLVVAESRILESSQHDYGRAWYNLFNDPENRFRVDPNQFHAFPLRFFMKILRLYPQHCMSILSSAVALYRIEALSDVRTWRFGDGNRPEIYEPLFLAMMVSHHKATQERLAYFGLDFEDIVKGAGLDMDFYADQVSNRIRPLKYSYWGFRHALDVMLGRD